MTKKIKIGILGTRGIPNRYGGFEQCAEYLALGLTDKGHEVWVYNAHNHEYQGDTWKGVNIIHCNDPEHKLGTAGQFIYDYNCIKDARKRNYDILLQLGYTSNSIWHQLWPKKCRNIVNMDGLEWRRSKYNKHVQRFLKQAEKWAATNADMLIADSKGIQQHLHEAYHKGSLYIPYGAEIFNSPNKDKLEPYNLHPFCYHLVIARMEPENNVEMIIRGVLGAGTKKPLIIVGKTDNDHGKYLKEKYSANENIQFVGGIYDKEVIDNLRYYSTLYFHGHTVGGTNPSLLEAMAAHALIAAHNNIFNRSILGDDALYFKHPDDVTALITTIANKDVYSQQLSNNTLKIKSHYSWPTIVDQYEKCFFQALTK